MRRVFGLRFLVEAALIVLVTVFVSFADGSTAAILGAIAGTWVLIAVAEWGLSHRGRELRVEERAEPATQPPEPELERVPEPATRHVRIVEPAPQPEPDPAPEPEPEPEPEPAAARVVELAPPPGPPRKWNLWELERIARERAGAESERDEERIFLLMYLRDFADPDGVLPVTFDPLVREAFADDLGSARP